MILDTSFLVDLMDGDADAAAEARRLEAERIGSVVPSMTVTELFIGVAYSEHSAREVEKIREVLEPRPIVETDEEVARRAGRIIGRLKREGEPIGRGDAVIAATGLVHDLPVFTRNVADFARVPGLAVRSY